MYGWGHNEQVVGRAIKGRRDRVVLATKFGQTQNPGGPNGVNGRPEYVMQACEASLKRLGEDVIDLYYQHRVDPSRADRGHRRRDGEAGAAGQGEAPRAVGSEAGDDPPRAQGASDRRVQTEYSLLYRDRGRGDAGDHARPGHQLRGLCAAGARLPDRRDPDIRRCRWAARGASALPEGELRSATARWWRRSRRSRRRRDARRRSSRWPGCWRRATTSWRSPARGTRTRLEENLGALRVELTRGGCGADFRGGAARRGGGHALSGGRDEGGLRLNPGVRLRQGAEDFPAQPLPPPAAMGRIGPGEIGMRLL